VTTQVAPPAPRLSGATAARPAVKEAHVARIETILLATDASSASGAATLHAIDLAARLGAQLVVLTVLSTADRDRQARDAGSSAASRRDARTLAVQQVVERARAEGARSTSLVWDGEPGEAIVDAADAEHADLIVVGSHERSTVGRFFLGSVSDYVVRHARAPVMVVRPSAFALAASDGANDQGSASR
jgi:nucleotide-binding universal stress UspA family protein